VDLSSVSCNKQKNIGVGIQYTGTETNATERDFGYSIFLLQALALPFSKKKRNVSDEIGLH